MLPVLRNMTSTVLLSPKTGRQQWRIICSSAVFFRVKHDVHFRSSPMLPSEVFQLSRNHPKGLLLRQPERLLRNPPTRSAARRPHVGHARAPSPTEPQVRCENGGLGQVAEISKRLLVDIFVAIYIELYRHLLEGPWYRCPMDGKPSRTCDLLSSPLKTRGTQLLPIPNLQSPPQHRIGKKKRNKPYTDFVVPAQVRYD